MALKDDELRKDSNFIFNLERNIRQYFFILNIIFAVIIVLLILLFSLLLPLKEKKPYLVFFSDAQSNFVRVEQANYNIRANEALLKGIIASYVLKRETINRIDDIQRYEEIRMQSASKVWTTFSTLVAQANSIYSTRGIFREIKIINSSILTDKVATVDFTATTINQSTGEKNFKRYRASLSYDFRNVELNFDSLPKNPTGFIINEYALTEVDLQGVSIKEEN
ncbi:type IV secretion system protein [Campylobacter sp. MIT 97-5078]|uniref:type IV secretion system protein n=1 Tax=Campylobacter sp. MIT 97-5078 TaxID=1548153 RepID=UPI000512C192|nr:type IV secretion system protein [Campylobacter sp. MIT 97-5078]KGI55491.1 virulence protein [Campylobacter sp. MIT 97-5078]KGI56817.1 virulence protein [Campylobacter sp. MIT 97-5078]TQR25594.1 virulence protein [Campylobacter sp. MIT 97-5078]